MKVKAIPTANSGPQLLMIITGIASQQVNVNGLVAAFEGMSVDTYFKQQGYSLKAPAKRQTLNAQSSSSLTAAQQLHVKTPSSNPKVSHEMPSATPDLVLSAAKHYPADSLHGLSALLSCGSMGSSQKEGLLYNAERLYAENRKACTTMHDPILSQCLHTHLLELKSTCYFSIY